MSGIKRYACLALLIGLAMFAGLAATMPPSSLSPIRTPRLEVVNADGAVVFRVDATDVGGRLEVRNAAGNLIFSAGTDADADILGGLWEQARYDITHQRRDLDRLRLEVQTVARQVENMERQLQPRSRAAPIETDVERQRGNLDRYRRHVDTLERRIDQISRQVDSLERRR